IFAEAHYIVYFGKGQSSAEDGHDVLYTNQVYYNKELLVSYNSTEGRFIGYTNEAIKIADGLNRNKYIADDQKNNFEICKQVASDYIKLVGAGAQKPQVRVFSTKAGSSHQPGILVCSAYRFYPQRWERCCGARSAVGLWMWWRCGGVGPPGERGCGAAVNSFIFGRTYQQFQPAVHLFPGYYECDSFWTIYLFSLDIMNTGVSLLLCFPLFFQTGGAHYTYALQNCRFTTEDDAVVIGQAYYNKQLFVSFNTTEGNFTGYTKEIKEITNGVNQNPRLLNDLKNAQRDCDELTRNMLTYLQGAAQEPQVRVFSTKARSSHQPGMLVCSAYRFYPKALTLTWLRNGEEVTSGVTFTDEMSNGNWLYQKHSYLEYTPTAEDQISCMVEHASLSTPQLYPLENFPESRRNKLIVGTAGLLLGLAFLIAGVIYYKKHTKGHVLVPQH
ncbi:HLA class I histocompatibility antigen, alpha chain F-like, partial [Boleophthalmus pectinirostris]|uniref:HLA class I histocompatibility antigen, alpha chain F-like n=1 Tax=Boleophthalmus pectinirostris TaxID=150288 RepID=UPI00242CFFE2